MKLYKGDTSSVNSTITNSIDNLKSDIENVSNSINDFINSSMGESKLAGEDFDRVRYHMNDYVNTFKNLCTKLESVKETINSNNNSMESFAQGSEFNPLDTDKISDYEKQISNLNDRINYYHSLGRKSTVEELSLNNYSRIIDSLYNLRGLYESRKKYLEEFQTNDATYYSNIEASINDFVNKSNSSCSNIQVMNITDKINTAISQGLTGDNAKNYIMNSITYSMEADK